MHTQLPDMARAADGDVRRSLHTISTLLHAADGHDGVPAATRDCLERMAAEVRDLANAYRRIDQVTTPAPVPAPGLRRHFDDVGDARHGAGAFDPGRDPAELRALTTQERRILELIAEGCTNRQIARDLFLAEKTVKNYVSNVLRKLGMERRTQAAVYATRLDRALLRYRGPSEDRLPA